MRVQDEGATYKFGRVFAVQLNENWQRRLIENGGLVA
jgi:hypothetical protein